MKVLLVSEPGVDGVFRFVEALAHYLVDQGVEVHYAYSDRRGSDRLQTLVDFVRERGGRTLNLATSNLPALSDLPALHKLRQLVHTVRPDIIHSHSSKAGVLARALTLSGVTTPQVYQPHAYFGMRPQPGVMRLFYDTIEGVLGRWSTTVNSSHAEHDYARARLRLSPGRAICIHNGVDTTHFSPASAEEKVAIRRRLGLPTTGRIMGVLGRASTQKDPLTTYRAFAAALKQDPSLVLFHLGKGELDGEINQFIAEHHLEKKIYRMPYLSTPVDFYRAVDGFMLTSLYEGMSLAALEAMSCDLPLILSEAPGNQEFRNLPLTHLWTAPIGDVPGFAKALVEWSADASAVPNHRSYAVEHFDNRKTYGDILALYRQLRQGRSHGRTSTPPLRPQASAKTGF